MTLFICRHCGSERKNNSSWKNHERSCPSNPNRNYKNGMTGKKGGNQFTKAEELGLEKPPGTMKGKPGTFTGKKHTEDTKKKISESRKKFIEENPHMSPWVYSHYTKRKSYAERYWKKILVKYGIQFEEQYQISRYCLDFAIVDFKINIEIDGEQHYLDQRIVKSDKHRNEYLENLGWKIIRIRWSEYKKLVNKQDRIDYVTNIINEIRTGTQVDKGN